MIDAISRWILALFIVVLGHQYVSSTPVWSPQVVNGGFGRNIRHLPCVSRRSGETGVCMFAYSCAKANGTHLGTCIDRFYFGSCCKVASSNLDLAPQLESNNISEETVLGLSSTESYLSPTYQNVQLVNKTSEVHKYGQTSTAVPQPDILPPVRKPVVKPQVITTKPTSSIISTQKPPTTEALNVNSTIPVFSKPTKPLYTGSVSTHKPILQNPVTSLITNYSKPTKRPTINPILSPGKPLVENRPKPTPIPSVKPDASSTKPLVGQPVLKPIRPTVKPVSTVSKPYTKPSLIQSGTKPTSSPTKPISVTKPKPQISTVTNNKIKPNIKPSGNKTNQSSVNETTLNPTKKPPLFNNESKPGQPITISSTEKYTIKPVKVTRPTQKPLLTSKPLGSSKPVTITKPSKPSANLTRPTTSRPQYTSKPVVHSKPSQKPIVSSKPTITKPSSPTYIEVPLASTPATKVTVPSTTISNEILPDFGNFSTVSSVEYEEEVSNLINGSPSPPTDIPPALVTWTTVDEVPIKPISKPGSTPINIGVNTQNKTKIPVSPTTMSSLTMETWVEVSVSTHEPSQSELGNIAITKPSIISTTTSRPTTSRPTTSESTTTVGVNTTVLSSTSTVNTDTTEGKLPSLSSSVTEETTTSTTFTVSQPTESPVNSTIKTTENYLGLQSNYTDNQSINEIETTNLNTSNYIDVCGRRLFPQSRIVGGDKATFGKWPWQISLRQWRTSTYLHKCGAALLNENWAITAAHCVENVPPSDLLLRLGEHDLSLEDEPYGYQERRVQIVASHPQFDSRTFEYDLALLRFYEPITFQPNVIPVCVPQDDTNFVGSTAYVTGWGRLYEDGPLPSVLQEVSVPVINNTVCETMYRAAGYIEHIPEIFICAGWKKGGFDSCEGDSGGPMVIQRPDRRWLLAGVISWGIGCAEPNQPGVYTRISEFREWINQILQF